MTASHLRGYYHLTALPGTWYTHHVFLPSEDVIMYTHRTLGGHDTPPNLPHLTLWPTSVWRLFQTSLVDSDLPN